MIDLSYSNRTEPLVDALADNVAATQATLYDPVCLLVPNGFVEGYVKQGLARRRGIAAHVETHFLRAFLRKVAEESAPGLRIVDRDVLEGELLALFHDDDRLATAALAPVRTYLADDGEREALDRRRAQLAAKLAELFDEYAYSRPEMLAVWRKGKLISGWDEPLQTWQRALWLALFGQKAALSGEGTVTLPDFFARTPPDALRLPRAVHVFGISFVARLYRSIFASLGHAAALFVYTLNPCRELWEDLQPARRSSPKRQASSRQLAFALGDAPGATAAADENPLLALWGRPGRDSIRLYNDVSECDFRERFEDPAAGTARPTLLATIQREVLDRAPRGPDPVEADGSLVMFGAPDPSRELETVAAEIWSLLRRDHTLRFDDFAVVVPPASAGKYLPLARDVFTAASALPHTVLDLPSPAEGHVREAVELLLALPAGPLGRRDLLPLAMHPTVARRFPDADPDMFLTLCEQLGIVRGADGADLGESYLEHDRVSWDQGLRRLALGAFLSGRRSGEERPFSSECPGEGPLLAAELPAGAEPAARALGIIARELIDFACTARGLRAPIAEHMALLRRTLAATIRPEGDEEQALLRDCFAVLERLAETAPPELEVGFAIAAELVRARLGAAHRRSRAPEGVTVATFAPLRALPFRVVFMLGLDERVFPSAAGFDKLDLRGAAPAPQPGDVTPREQDEYVFLETLLSARQRVYLSWVARDAETGERKDPSSTVLALRDLLGQGPGGAALLAGITRAGPPLARHLDDAVCAVIPAAARERRAVTLGRSLREAADVIQLPEASALRAALSGAAATAIAAPLGHLALGAKPATPRRAVTTLTLADLRRFLECPLQGSVRVLLPMRDDGDAEDEAEAALRERENLGDARPETLPLLREVFAGAIDAGASDDGALAERYDAAIACLRLDGTLPSGVFGAVLRARHLALLRSWRDGLRAKLAGRLPTGLTRIFYGGAPEHRRDVAIAAGIPLSVPLPDGPRAVTLHGQTEALALVDDERMAVALVTGQRAYLERDRLGAWLTQLALAAAGVGADRPLASLVLAGTQDGEPADVSAGMFAAVGTDAARSLLAALAAELLADVHPYLLPCEGVFTWKRRQRKGEAMTVGEAVLLLRDDGVTRLSSRYGPVADALRYPVPADRDAAAIVARRFQPYFDSFQELKERR